MLLQVEQLSVAFATEHGEARAVRDVSFDMPANGRVALVGESGCGKTATALAIIGLLAGHATVGGKVLLEGASVLGRRGRTARETRGHRIAMVYQDPFTALNPVMRIGPQIVEAMERGRKPGRKAKLAQAAELLGRVGINDPSEQLRRYPHQLSGGMRQRVVLAMALAARPRLLIADEPTTALDVTVQAQIVRLLRGLVEEEAMGLLLISHDLALVGELAEEINVMYAGRIVERGPAEDILTSPAHPYSRALLDCSPSLRAAGKQRLRSIEGQAPPATAAIGGCAFEPRCSRRQERCATELPPLVPSTSGGQRVCACWNPLGAPASGLPKASSG